MLLLALLMLLAHFIAFSSDEEQPYVIEHEHSYAEGDYDAFGLLSAHQSEVL